MKKLAIVLLVTFTFHSATADSSTNSLFSKLGFQEVANNINYYSTYLYKNYLNDLHVPLVDVSYPLRLVSTLFSKPDQHSSTTNLNNIQSSDLDYTQHVPSSAVAVTFTNLSPHRASVFWDNEEEWVRVVDVLPPGESISLSTFLNHAFIFTREGTRDQLSERITIQPQQTTYFLSSDADSIDTSCRDRFTTKCPSYASAGECLKNPGWMIVNCPQSCNSCDLLDAKKRCDPTFLNVSSENVWKPGDLNLMFKRILSDFKQEFDIEVLSEPPEGPWVLQFNNFLKPEEVSVLKEWGMRLGYQRSTDTGKENDRGEVTKIFSTGRTSSNAWCIKGCESDPFVKNVSDRIVNITHIPYNNYEQFQILQYEVGQYYKTHHDMGPKEDGRAGGVRILTFFLYLSDVEEGGETHFPMVKDMKVKPVSGRAILWPSVLDEDPEKQDGRTFHAALPVIKGQKYAANHWIHSHDFKIANLWGCTGAFD